ncbi:MAG: type I restriction endonuclease subunit M [Burkholderiales bacterium]|nr:MAG: type I restriction endonuclease subunit M [Burkholderiales bacterium]
MLRSGTRKHRCTPAAPTNGQPLFRLGSVYATPAALALLEEHGVSGATLLVRHQCGDFGHLGADSIRDNRLAIERGGRIISAYRLLSEDVLTRMTSSEQRRTPTAWIISEADRSATTILLPDEY